MGCPTPDPLGSITAEQLLQLVAGDLCPCGHNEKDHEDPDGSIPGETMGACMKCDCKGVIDLWDPNA